MEIRIRIKLINLNEEKKGNQGDPCDLSSEWIHYENEEGNGFLPLHEKIASSKDFSLNKSVKLT